MRFSCKNKTRQRIRRTEYFKIELCPLSHYTTFALPWRPYGYPTALSSEPRASTAFVLCVLKVSAVGWHSMRSQIMLAILAIVLRWHCDYLDVLHFLNAALVWEGLKQQQKQNGSWCYIYDLFTNNGSFEQEIINGVKNINTFLYFWLKHKFK